MFKIIKQIKQIKNSIDHIEKCLEDQITINKNITRLNMITSNRLDKLEECIELLSPTESVPDWKDPER